MSAQQQIEFQVRVLAALDTILARIECLEDQLEATAEALCLMSEGKKLRFVEDLTQESDQEDDDTEVIPPAPVPLQRSDRAGYDNDPYTTPPPRKRMCVCNAPSKK